MIEAFRLTRFRGFEDTDWIELKPLTLFFGHNSSGKSSLLAGLLMLRQSWLNPDSSTPFVFSSDQGVDLGSYEDLVYGHHFDAQRPLSLSLQLHLDEPYFGWSQQLSSIRLRFQIGYDARRKVTWLMSVGYFTTDDLRLLSLSRDWKPSARLVENRISGWRVSSDVFSPHYLPDPKEFSWQHFLPLTATGSRTRAHPSVTELCQQVAKQAETDFRSLVHIGPLRTEPERVYYFTGEGVADVGRRGENTYKLLAAVQYQGNQAALARRLNRWLERLGYRLSVKVFENSPLLQIGVREGETTGADYNLKDVGFGISQVLPLLVQCYAGGRSRVILLEQPELHLHPRAQADLGDFLIDALGEGHRFIIETHSEHLLLRLRRRVAEATVYPDRTLMYGLGADQLQSYFVERRNGHSQVNPVGVDPFGQIPKPPEGFRRFFSDDYEEIVKISQTIAEYQSHLAEEATPP